MFIPDIPRLILLQRSQKNEQNGLGTRHNIRLQLATAVSWAKRFRGWAESYNFQKNGFKFPAEKIQALKILSFPFNTPKFGNFQLQFCIFDKKKFHTSYNLADGGHSPATTPLGAGPQTLVTQHPTILDASLKPTDQHHTQDAHTQDPFGETMTTLVYDCWRQNIISSQEAVKTTAWW